MSDTRLSRRQFLALSAAGALLAVTGCARRGGRIGLALGGGGARGLAHILMLEAFDAVGIKPHRIAGTSIGAVIGALYASGQSGSAIKALVNQLTVTEKDTWKDILFSKHPLEWLDFLEADVGGGGLVDSAGFIRFLHRILKRNRFQELDIPLKVVAADLWTGEQVVFHSGDLLPALKASIAVPGLFEPVKYDGHVLVDGGTVNPVPYDLLTDCDITVAIDVGGVVTPPADGTPSYAETIFVSIHNMEQTILDQKLHDHPPDIYIRPDIQNVRVLEFYKAEEIYRQAAPAAAKLRRTLTALKG
jgi:NTE family protein